MNNLWVLVGMVRASEFRKKVLTAMASKPLMPSEIGKAINKRTSHVSSTLSELKKLGLVKCLNPNAVRGRLYTPTRKGKEVIKKIKD